MENIIDETQLHGKLLTFVAIDSKPAGVTVFQRPNLGRRSGNDRKRLHQLGVEQTVMLAGDNAENAQTIAKETGIQNV
ncbi:MAG: hypothetical protein ACREBS_01940 [Nitrososphaerales archaeon]